MVSIHVHLSLKAAEAYPYQGKSTRHRLSLIKKKFINLVFHGLADTFTREFLSTSIFIREDFQTLDLPIKANSGTPNSGHSWNFDALFTNVALRIIMYYLTY